MYVTTLSQLSKLILGVVVMLILTAAAILPSVYADTINPGLFSIDSSPYGTSNGNWSIKWWKWFMQIPQAVNPATDKTGALCSSNQTDPNVWFTIGVFEGSAERTCKIPPGKAIFFAHGIECSKIENKLNTDAELRKCAVQGLPTLVASFEASIDGVQLKNLTHYNVISDPYNVYFPPKNVWGVPAGITRSVADTYIIFLQPLSPGNHVFQFKANSPANPLAGATSAHALEVKYNLIVGK
jgi:hypothetical protein